MLLSGSPKRLGFRAEHLLLKVICPLRLSLAHSCSSARFPQLLFHTLPCVHVSAPQSVLFPWQHGLANSRVDVRVGVWGWGGSDWHTDSRKRKTGKARVASKIVQQIQ